MGDENKPTMGASGEAMVTGAGGMAPQVPLPTPRRMVMYVDVYGNEHPAVVVGVDLVESDPYRVNLHVLWNQVDPQPSFSPAVPLRRKPEQRMCWHW